MTGSGSFAAKAIIGLLTACALLIVVAANWHLVYVAIHSQPECVTHIRPGESAKGGPQFAAAKSSCTPTYAGERPQQARIEK
jgi:hypothetical protein